MARRPLVVLPSGHLIFAEDLPRFGRKARAAIEGIVFGLLLFLVIFGAALVDPMRP